MTRVHVSLMLSTIELLYTSIAPTITEQILYFCGFDVSIVNSPIDLRTTSLQIVGSNTSFIHRLKLPNKDFGTSFNSPQ